MYIELKLNPKNETDIVAWRSSNKLCVIDSDVYYDNYIPWIETHSAPDDFEKTYLYYSYNKNSNEYIVDIQKKEEYEREFLIIELRFRRERECFPIINRGTFWYEMLTEVQLKELKDWYVAWLNVTETLVPPDPLPWI